MSRVVPMCVWLWGLKANKSRGSAFIIEPLFTYGRLFCLNWHEIDMRLFWSCFYTIPHFFQDLLSICPFCFLPPDFEIFLQCLTIQIWHQHLKCPISRTNKRWLCGAAVKVTILQQKHDRFDPDIRRKLHWKSFSQVLSWVTAIAMRIRKSSRPEFCSQLNSHW